MKRFLSVLLSLVIVCSCFSITTVNATQEEDIVSIAKSQIGYHGRPNDFTYWYGSIGGTYSYHWCAAFVSWCANQAGISTDIIPKHCSCNTGMKWFKDRGQWQDSIYQGGSYTPQAGDIVYYSDSYSQSDSTHVGIVTGTNGEYLTVVEGNTENNQVKEYTTNSKRKLNSGYILGYGTPNYTPQEPDDNYADIGTNFYAVIKNTKYNNYVSKVSGTNDIYLQDGKDSSRQVWYFERQDDGAYAISSCYDGKYLEMTNGTRENSTHITAHDDFWGGYYQQWYLIPSGDGYKIKSKHYTSEGWYLDRSGTGSNKVQIYEEYQDSGDQIWTIDKDEAISDLGDKFYSVIRNTKNGDYLSEALGTNNIYVKQKDNTSKQVWYFERQEDGAYAISSSYDGKYLEMSGGIRENRTQITVADTYWEGYYQQWYFIPCGDGYRILSKHYTSEGWYLDRSARGDEVAQIYEKYSVQDDQIWTVDKESAIANLGDNFDAVISNTKYDSAVSRVDDSNLIFLKDKDNSKNQGWNFQRQNDGVYVIYSKVDGKVLEMSSGITENKTQISVANTYWGGNYQQWYLIPSGDGYRFLSKHYVSQGWYLDRSGTGDNHLQIYEKYADQDDQIWSLGEYKEHNHNYISKVTTPATCLENGIKTYTCSTCGDTYTETIPETGHKVVIDKAVPPTATESGLTQGEHCGVCGKVLIPQEVIKPIGIIGDIDGDGEVNIKDATTLQKHLANLIVLDNKSLTLADSNGDGIINISDSTQIQKYLADLIDKLG